MPNLSLEDLFQQQKKKSWELRSAPWKQRLTCLKKLQSAILENEQNIIQALHEDFQKPEMEVLISEIYPCLHELRGTLAQLAQWVQAEEKNSGLFLFGTKSWVQFEPKGTILVISPWNYPFALAMTPLISALAAGNTVTVKPSELTPKTSALIKKILESIFPAELVSVVEGGKEIAEKLLALPYDHIFFTGSTTVGKIVMHAAAKNLSSVTLELGGKSPTIIDETADLKLAVSKIVWGKFLNAGQTCVAPDYIFIPHRKYDEFVQYFHQEIQKQKSAACQIITNRHCLRLEKLVQQARQQGATIETSGPTTDRTFAPTLLKIDPANNSELMKEEIFGPILPIMTYEKLDQVLSYIQAHPKPLALYVFSRNQKSIDRILTETSSGGVCINDVVLHYGNSNLPFGGVGESGMGQYHGHYGFKSFSHEKAILRQGPFPRLINQFYPPYKNWVLKVLRFLIRKGL